MLPLTDPEQRLTEIWDACYGGKVKKVQLSWTPQLRASHDQTAFSINKGVKTFDLCGKHGLLVTGGLDSLVRMWNPHFSGWGIAINSSGLPWAPGNVRHFNFLLRSPGNQLEFWEVTRLPSATSASPLRTVRSSPSPWTTPLKWPPPLYINQPLMLLTHCCPCVSKSMPRFIFKQEIKALWAFTFPQCLYCGSPVHVSGLGHSGAALLAHGGLQGKRHPRWHNRVLVLLLHEVPLCCRRRHGCALPEDKVGGCASVFSSWKNLSPVLWIHLRKPPDWSISVPAWSFP